MAEDKIALCCAALVMAGANKISSFEDGTIESTVAGEVYEKLVQAILTRQRWHFAKITKSLGAVLAYTPAEQWAYAYQLPAEPAVLDVHTVLRDDQPVSYAIEGDKVFCDQEADVSIRYTWRPDESRWPPWFAWLVIAELAAAFADAFDRTEKGDKLREKTIPDARTQAIRANTQSQTATTIVRKRLIVNRLR